MSERELRAAIEKIRGELAHAKGLSDSDRDALHRLTVELEARLEHPGARPENDTLRQELTDWVRELEASHPVLSTNLGRVIDTLAFFNL